MDYTSIKEILLRECRDYVNKRIDAIQEAIIAAREAAEEDDKSSAGDKYETGRAMMHIEIENQMAQLKEAQRMATELEGISVKSNSGIVRKGSIVMTDQGFYYLSVGAGKITVGENDYFAVGVLSPIGKALLGAKEGDDFTLNNRRYTIQHIY